MPRLITATKFAESMSGEGENGDNGVIDILTNPSRTLANWYFWLGSIGILLAILNMAGLIHPNYRVSWGGLLTFEMTNAAFGDKDTAPAFVASDAIFIAICGALIYFGIKTLASEEGVGEWFKGLVTNDWYNDLVGNEDGNWSLIIGTWSIFASMVFYFYWGIMYMAWIDPGVYSITIALMAVGLVARNLATLPSEESD